MLQEEPINGKHVLVVWIMIDALSEVEKEEKFFNLREEEIIGIAKKEFIEKTKTKSGLLID
jgi:hypothetical protein